MASIANMIGGGDSSAGGKKLIPTLQQASTLVQQILKDVQSLDTALSSVVAKAGAVRTALGGSGQALPNYGLAAAGGSLYPQGNFLPTVTFNGMTAPNGGAGGGTGGTSGATNQKFGWGKTIAAQAVAGFFGQAGSDVAMATQDEVLFNRLRTVNAGSFSQGGGVGTLANLYSAGGRAGFIGNQDLTGAVGSAFNAGAFNVTSPGFAHALASVSQSTNTTLSQTMGATLSAASNPMAVVRLQAMGVNVLNSRGQPNDPMTIAAQLQRASGANYGKGAAGTQRVQADFGLYGPMRQELQMMGISDEDITQIYMPMFEASQQSGKTIGAGGSAAFGSTMKSLGFGQDRFGTSARERSGAQADLYNAQFRSMMRGAEAADRLAVNADHAAKALADIAGYAKGFSGAIGTKQDGTGSPFGNIVNNLVHDYFDYKVLKMLGGKGGVGGGAAKVLEKVGLGGVAESVGLGAGAAGLTKILRGGLIGVGGQVVGSALSKSGHSTLGAMAGDAGTGAAIGSFIGPEGTAIGAGAGALLGLLNSRSHTKITSVQQLMGLPAGVGVSLLRQLEGEGMSLAQINTMLKGGGGAGFGGASTDKGVQSGGAVSANALAQFAAKYVGTPYSWGGGGTSGPGRGAAQGSDTVGFDCSSFTQFVFAHFGVMLPRTTYDQVKVGVSVSAHEAMPGDLMFFDGPPSAPGHVGIYLGNGQMIEAPHTGSTVRIRAVDPASAVAIKRVMNAQGTVSGLDGGGNASGAPANSYTTALGALTNGAIARAQNMAGVTPGFHMTPGALGGMLGANTTSPTVPAQAGAAPTSISGAVKMGQKLAAARGWTGSNWNSLYALWNRESSWNENAVNPTSGAYGIPQALPAAQGHPFALGDAAAQEKWGLDYIARRYKTPDAAYQHEVQVGWYDKGAWKIKNDQPAVVHQDEMILPATLADQVRTAITGSGGGHRGGCTVTLQVYPASADETAAKRLATMVKELLDEHDHYDTIGSGS